METRQLLLNEEEGDYLDDSFDVRVKQPDNECDEEQSSSKSDEPVKSVPYYRLFRYATCADILLLLIGVVSATAHGAGLPVMFLFFGKLTDAFTTFGIFKECNFNYTTCVNEGLFNGTEEEFANASESARNLGENTLPYIYYLVYIAAGVLVFATLQTGTFCLQASRQTNQIRVKYVRAVLRQDIGYHDLNPPGEINSRLSDDIKKVYDGMADKVPVTLQQFVLIAVGLTLAFMHSWKLTLVSLAVTPLTIFGSGFFFAISGNDPNIVRYSSMLKKARVLGIKRGTLTGASIGLLYLAMFGSYAVTFWYGVHLVVKKSDDQLTPGDMMVVFYNVLIAAFALGTAGGNMEYFSAAKAAAQKIFTVIDREPAIDVFSDTGLKPQSSNGEISFRNVNFSYPSRNTVQILKDVTFTVEKGETVALVGQSGCGKSTCISLIQRFYDIQSGSVEIDGLNVDTLNVKWLRDNIGVVAQEPVLFNMTIAENIKWGDELKKKFETVVGESGGQLSGGQKQRIAIARAIVRDPKIMLLDEATSALDTESEAIVQSALDKAAAGRTTIIVAHRLSTIRNADKIVAFHEGRVTEEGTHAELMRVTNGVYANLVNMQTVNADSNEMTTLPEDGEGSLNRVTDAELS